MTPALDKALPEFEALATGGVKFSPQAYAGKIVVLYFYPKDNTPGCTTEAMQFRDHHKDFLAAGAVLERAYAGLKATGSSVGIEVPLYPFKDFSALMGFDWVAEFDRKHRDG